MGKRLIVIGAGASGLIAAGRAAQCGADVVILEKMPRPARKLMITGKGRCNLTNIAEIHEFVHHFGTNGKFLHRAFGAFFSGDLLSLLDDLGVETLTERGGRVFPKSNSAREIVDALTRWVKQLGVGIHTTSPVKAIKVGNSKIESVIVAGGKEYACEALIIATGGASYPATGSSGDGYKFAESVGHRINPIHPALVPLEVSGEICGRLQGLSLKNVNLTLLVNDKKVREEFGEMLFTHYGLSGPIVLTVSGMAVRAIAAGKSVRVSIDLKPALDDKILDTRLLREFSEHSKKQFSSVLRTLMPLKMIPVCAELTGIPEDMRVSQISGTERKALRNWLKGFALEISGYRPFEEAIITSGGVDVREVNPGTMESKIIKNLYFAGEVLDIDADTGGYNLQAAFSTGWLAGTSAAK
jgi:predicted Rossmann fold flavoprotein